MNTAKDNLSASALDAATAGAAHRAEWSDPRTVFSAMLHQLSQPLTVLRGQLELALRKSRSRQEYRQALERAVIDAERLMELFRSARRVAEVAEERATQTLSLSSLLNGACDDLRLVAGAEGISLAAEIEDGIEALGHALSLKETLFNLIGYAIRRSGPGGSVNIFLARRGADAAVTITAHPEKRTEKTQPMPPPAILEEDSAGAGLPDDWLLAVARCTLAGMGGALEIIEDRTRSELHLSLRASALSLR
jgi:signal transduction histidine kinase